MTALKQYVAIDAREVAPASVASFPSGEVDHQLYGTLTSTQCINICARSFFTRAQPLPACFSFYRRKIPDTLEHFNTWSTTSDEYFSTAHEFLYNIHVKRFRCRPVSENKYLVTYV